MSRYCGENTVVEPILEAAEYWKTNALISDGAIFANKQIWNLNCLQKLESIVEQLTNKNFYENLETQLGKSEQPETVQLAAEICWVVHLCPSNTSISKSNKRERIKGIWEQSDNPFPEDSKWLKDNILGGIGHPGQAFIARQQSEWMFFVRSMIAFKKLSEQQRVEYLVDSWEFAKWLENIPKCENRALRHMILFLLFPENFERIFSGSDRKSIVGKSTKQPTRKLSMLEMDQHIFEIRQREQEKRGTTKLDFYHDPLKGTYLGDTAESASIETRFPWIRFYRSIADKLLDFKNKREELVEEIHRISEQVPALSGLQDKSKDGTTGPLKDIDPFTTIGIFNQGHTFKNRRIIASELAKFLGVNEPPPDTFDGIPVVSSQNAWFFSYEKDRHPDDIDTLWEIFDQAINFAESEKTDNRSAFISAYDRALQIKGTGWNLSMGLYWIRPLTFPTLDGKSRDYVEKEFGMKIPKQYPDANNYLEILDTLKERFKDDECPVHSFPELSLAAWLFDPNAPPPSPPEKSATNLILYGPPGTGKTYQLKKLTEKYSNRAQTLNRKAWLVQELSDVLWFDAIFAALYDLNKVAKLNAILKHEYVQAKAESVSNKNISATVSTELVEHSKNSNPKYSRLPCVFSKNADGEWSLANSWKKECQEQIELAENWKNGPRQESSHQRFEFVTFHQAYGYEDFVEGIRPVVDEKTESVKYEVVPGVFRRICRRAKADPSQQYAIFIDEINRGNIASILGELITLLETDKRVMYREDGSPEPGKGMTLTLPYSGEQFGVPANLDVYGTMNTADRSIALLDTALRRRFQFRELIPDASVIKNLVGDNGSIEDGEGGTIDLCALLEAMNRRIRFLLSRDMTIGHSYFINVRNFSDLKNVLFSRIIPLLQEYFYDDWHRIQLVFRDVGPDNKEIEPQIIRHEPLKEVEVIGFDHDEFEDSIEYSVTPEDKITPVAVRKIYEENN